MWEAENICLLAQGVYFKTVTAILSLTLISWESSSPVTEVHLHAAYTPLTTHVLHVSSRVIPVTTRTAVHKAQLLRSPPLQHESQTLQVVLAPLAELPVKVTHMSCLRLICSFLHEFLAVLALWMLLQTVRFVQKGHFWFHAQIRRLFI